MKKQDKDYTNKISIDPIRFMAVIRGKAWIGYGLSSDMQEGRIHTPLNSGEGQHVTIDHFIQWLFLDFTMTHLTTTIVHC